MARVTVEDCIEKIPNRFDLVLMASQRSRDVSAGAPLSVDRDRDKNPVVALREIAEETINLEALHNLLIKGLQRQVEVDEPEDDVVDYMSREQILGVERNEVVPAPGTMEADDIADEADDVADAAADGADAAADGADAADNAATDGADAAAEGADAADDGADAADNVADDGADAAAEGANAADNAADDGADVADDVADAAAESADAADNAADDGADAAVDDADTTSLAAGAAQDVGGAADSFGPADDAAADEVAPGTGESSEPA